MLKVPRPTYAVFSITFRGLMDTLHLWLPAFSFTRADGPAFELSDSDFDPADPESRLCIYIPIRPREDR